MNTLDKARASQHPTVSGRRLVIATVIFGAVVGSSAFLVRPYMRRARARQTFQSLQNKLAANGVLIDGAPQKGRPPPPELPRPEEADAPALRALLRGQQSRQADTLGQRASVDALLDRSLDLINKALDEGRLSRQELASLGSPLEELLEDRAWKGFIERLLIAGVARYDEIIAGYHRKENPVLALFHSAEAEEMKVSYVRMTATALEALEVPYEGGLIIARRADEVAAQQEKRLRDQELRLFPEIEEAVEREFRLRARLRLLSLAIAIAREPDKAPELAARSLDPITGKPFIIKDGVLLSRDGGQQELNLRLPMR